MRRARIGIAVVVGCVALTACSSGVDRGAPTAHVVIDADVGSDALMAMAYLLANPDVQVDAITVCEPGSCTAMRVCATSWPCSRSRGAWTLG